MIKEVFTVTFKDEMLDQNSVPIVFFCSDFETYFCKSKLNEFNHDYLVYELIGNKLAKYFSITTPEIAYVRFKSDAMGNDFLQKNYRVEDGDLLFGSRFIGNYDTVDKTNKFYVKNNKQFSKLGNPVELLRISIMDVHLNNSDRNEENYNLLYHTEKRKFYAIDHAAIFGGPALKGNFSPKGSAALGNKLIGSFLLKNILKYLSLEQIEIELDTYFSKCEESLKLLIEELFVSLPPEWAVSENLQIRVLDYVLDETRNKLTQLLLIDRLHSIKKKS